jgi:hypothetical protein
VEIRAADIAVELEPEYAVMCFMLIADNAHEFPHCNRTYRCMYVRTVRTRVRTYVLYVRTILLCHNYVRSRRVFVHMYYK